MTRPADLSILGHTINRLSMNPEKRIDKTDSRIDDTRENIDDMPESFKVTAKGLHDTR